MQRDDTRHYSEEEILLHQLGEEAPEAGGAISAHLEECDACLAVHRDYEGVLRGIRSWEVEDFPADVWQHDWTLLLERLRGDQGRLIRRGALQNLLDGLQIAWNYALENPLPTLGYVVVALAFASERSFSVFGLDRIVPATSEVLRILMQFF